MIKGMAWRHRRRRGINIALPIFILCDRGLLVKATPGLLQLQERAPISVQEAGWVIRVGLNGHGDEKLSCTHYGWNLAPYIP
jgi:hypothetical protein